MLKRTKTQTPNVVTMPSHDADAVTSSLDAMLGGAPAQQSAESRMNRIARRAHELYEVRGGQHGKAMEDWLTAERQIDDEIDRS